MENLTLDYTIFCEDVRFESSNQISLMGITHQIVIPSFPVTLVKLAVINHWHVQTESGQYLGEVRLMTPDRMETIAVSKPASFTIPENGYADNITIFVNLNLPEEGDYVIQTLVNSNLHSEKILKVKLQAEKEQALENSFTN